MKKTCEKLLDLVKKELENYPDEKLKSYQEEYVTDLKVLHNALTDILHSKYDMKNP